MIKTILPEYTQKEIGDLINRNKIVLILRKNADNYIWSEAIGYQTGYHSWGGHEMETPWEWTYHHMHLREYNTGKSIWEMPDDIATPSEIFRFDKNASIDYKISVWNKYLLDEEHWFLQDYSDYISEKSASKIVLCEYLEEEINKESTIGIYIADGNSQKDISMTAEKLIKDFLLNNNGYYAETFGLEDRHISLYI